MDDRYLFSNPVPPEMQAVSMADLAAVGMMVVITMVMMVKMVGGGDSPEWASNDKDFEEDQ